MFRMLQAARIPLVAAVTCAVTGAARADLINLVDQDRNIEARVVVYTIAGNHYDDDADAADGFDPFSSEVVADTGGGPAIASQHSVLGDRGFSASGRVSVTAIGGDHCGMMDGFETWGRATSHFEVSFGLTATAEMTGRLLVDPGGGAITARLTGPGGTLHFAAGEARTDTLVPGPFDLFVEFQIEAFNRCPGGVGEITNALDYAFSLVRCPADLDESDVVDFADVLEVIGAWGDCFGCPEDLDANGVVDFGDVLHVLTSWGSC